MGLGESEIEHPACHVHESQEVPVHGRKCTVVEIRHPVREEGLRFHSARVFVDPVLRLPIGFESYDWPPAEGSEPPLLEEYVYLDLKLNVGLTDRDFDPANEAYRFGRPFGK